jgi:hypothetical protein
MMKSNRTRWIVFGVVAVTVVYALLTRSRPEFQAVAVPAIVVSACLTSVAFLVWMATVLRAEQAAARAAGTPIPVVSGAPGVVVMLIAAGIGIGFTGVAFVALDMVEAIQRITGRNTLVLVTIGSTLVFGTLLFAVRLHLRLVYGISEALVGVTVAAHRASVESSTVVPTQPTFYLAVLTAGIYLVVRGLDNIHQAIKNPDDPVIRGWREWRK